MSISCFLGMNYVLLQHEEIVIHMLLHLKNFSVVQTVKPVLDFEDIFETFSNNCFLFLQLVMDYISALILPVMDTSVVCSLSCKKADLIAKRRKLQKCPALWFYSPAHSTFTNTAHKSSNIL